MSRVSYFSSQPRAYRISFQNYGMKIIITQHKPRRDHRQTFEYANPPVLWFIISLGSISFVYLCYLLSSSSRTTPHPHFAKHQFLCLLRGFLLHYVFDRYIRFVFSSLLYIYSSRSTLPSLWRFGTAYTQWYHLLTALRLEVVVSCWDWMRIMDRLWILKEWMTVCWHMWLWLLCADFIVCVWYNGCWDNLLPFSI
jgi:hypothetical protein